MTIYSSGGLEQKVYMTAVALSKYFCLSKIVTYSLCLISNAAR